MLYIVGTPIGNLEDLSNRGAKTLLSVDIILAEDTRSVQSILNYSSEFTQRKRNDSQKIVSYYKDVEFEKLPSIVEWLKKGMNIALVSEAGMPVISDPGLLLIRMCRKYDIPVTVVPGPSAVDSAVAMSGIPHKQFHFVGFLPKKVGEKTKLFKVLQAESEMLDDEVLFVAFDSPERISDTIEIIQHNFPHIVMKVVRELTKEYEEIIENPKVNEKYKGEIVFLFNFKQKK